jgi:hypothetical protein
MPDLSVEAFGVAVVPHTDYVPVPDAASIHMHPARFEQESRGIPPEHRMLMAGYDTIDFADQPDVSALALAALGAPPCEQPLFLVRGMPRDSTVAALAGLVQGSGWAGEDIGITQLEELGGTVIFDLLDWAVPEETGATVLICDEPAIADARLGGSLLAAVGLRVRTGEGPLRVLDCGEGAPGAVAESTAEHRFAGSGPCDGWLALHEALTAGLIGNGERILIQARTPLHEGWLLLRAEATAYLRLVRRVPDAAR